MDSALKLKGLSKQSNCRLLLSYDGINHEFAEFFYQTAETIQL
ncbi:hypothetical protein VII00023_20437 [Vibrio ichthyoenteri ATCC 700023]|uniref:Uncharacterized protein n=1 Tax=Vibrio ichthyoenteri ATCC 700023 TaxID=870968 RepID=F9RXL9_9VIBR|nr:hypothetical protein VII00023_20437 [Vibrio ichthyoenteri ATCC 700023]